MHHRRRNDSCLIVSRQEAMPDATQKVRLAAHIPTAHPVIETAPANAQSWPWPSRERHGPAV